MYMDAHTGNSFAKTPKIESGKNLAIGDQDENYQDGYLYIYVCVVCTYI